MGRKDYMKDLANAPFLDIPNIEGIHATEDGEFAFTFISESGIYGSITAIVPDVSEYPKSHDYILFATDDAPLAISNALQWSPSTRRKTIHQLLDTLSKHLKSAVAQGTRNDPFELDDEGDVHFTGTSDPESVDEADNGFEVDGINEDWAQDDYDNFAHIPTNVSNPSSSFKARSGAATERARNDLLTAKAAGFKVGAHGFLAAGNACYLSLSCRISKLGISEEAMQAWSLESNQYLMLIMYYSSGYKDLQELISLPTKQAQKDFSMRVGVCDFYKPRSLADAQQFFKPGNTFKEQAARAGSKVKDTFISRAMHDLLNERLLQLINLRLAKAMSWYGAEKQYQALLGAQNHAQVPGVSEEYLSEDPPSTGYPRLVMEDELTSVKKLSQLSLPLVAMQFLLRHFARCTEFCLVCHTKLDSQLEAIKPYVCESPLCLFQYMKLGFGPSMEHEITAQPFVVDILVSFCYSSVVSSKLREYPQGLGWMVPHPTTLPSAPYSAPQYSYRPGARDGWNNDPSNQEQSRIAPLKKYKARLNRRDKQLLFDTRSCPLNRGQWIIISFKENFKDSDPWHCRIIDVMFPTVFLDEYPVIACKRRQDDKNTSAQPESKEPEADNPAGNWESVEFTIYEHNFDELSISEKRASMLSLMDMLPDVWEMKSYLDQNPGACIPDWHSRLPDACVGILRWIIASNRACIMQVDEVDKDVENNTGLALKPKKGESRIRGLGGYLIFRFAMGAPDKEQRFIDSLKNGNPQYPSLFAWHGSPLGNWHSIIREGLDFKEILNGRASGNGCYHAPDLHTSLGYSSRNAYGAGMDVWPSSILQANQAIALSEIVNAPSQFQCQSPYYVVQYVEWIQTRYLLVQPTEKITVSANPSDAEVLPQDPTRTPSGPNGPLAIPMSAIPRSRRPDTTFAGSCQQSKTSNARPIPKTVSTKFSRNPSKLTTDALAKHDKGPDPLSKFSNVYGSKQTGSLGTHDSPIDIDTASISTLDEDRLLLSEQTTIVPARPPTPPPSAKVPPTPVTAYKPHHVSSISAMPPPSYATKNASLTIQKAFRDVVKTQDSHIKHATLFELGWYVDAQHLEASGNLYQWIIHMHSFPLEIPLGQDMQKTGVDAIIFEMRFPSSYPFAPPFLRVITPRFLPFQMGGGGNVTAGGSICMDLLTSSGWNVAYSIESVLLQVRMALMSTDPRPARLNNFSSGGMGSYGAYRSKMNGGEYGVPEAVEAYVRACRTHGWAVPKELQDMTR